MIYKPTWLEIINLNYLVPKFLLCEILGKPYRRFVIKLAEQLLELSIMEHIGPFYVILLLKLFLVMVVQVIL